GAGHRIAFEAADVECGRDCIIHEHSHAPAGYDHADVVPANLAKGCAGLILRIEVPEHDAVRLRRILHTGVESGTGGVRTKVEEFEILFTLLAKGDAGHSAADRVHVELDRPIA